MEINIAVASNEEGKYSVNVDVVDAKEEDAVKLIDAVKRLLYTGSAFNPVDYTMTCRDN